ncbi:hypothetical protein [Crassaminicella profunda]|uniref:hypothetical protein n=1 Tax=Crassaminicella profunda TaxID=1286698 RepID=UPI001CA6B04C|nr:hypothetical protein [Crassaminicella profunda]QZY55103.1 hypothetical protein K7H06_19205 [Crassaminicella profunda]
MPSKNKTEYLGLNQWEGNEYPKRTDFVEDHVKIDNVVKDLVEGTVQNEKLKTINKTYMGAINELKENIAVHSVKIAKKSEIKVTETNVPIKDRKEGCFYFFVTDQAPTQVAENIKVSPTMGIKMI